MVTPPTGRYSCRGRRNLPLLRVLYSFKNISTWPLSGVTTVGNNLTEMQMYFEGIFLSLLAYLERANVYWLKGYIYNQSLCHRRSETKITMICEWISTHPLLKLIRKWVQKEPLTHTNQLLVLNTGLMHGLYTVHLRISSNLMIFINIL